MLTPVLTGTPVQNNLVELWSLLHWLYPAVFTTATEELFKTSFNLERGMYSLPFLMATQNLLSTIMLRRTKSMVEFDVPPKETLTVFLPLTELQRFWTYRLLTRLDNVELDQIFTTSINPENEIANRGRREVLSHLENQMQQVRAGGQANRTWLFLLVLRTIYITLFSVWKRLMNLLMQLRQVCDQSVA
jgi:SWI/SNF-related matrix-associated actin-dependent regulator of chromatin subfamily A member 5